METLINLLPTLSIILLVAFIIGVALMLHSEFNSYLYSPKVDKVIFVIILVCILYIVGFAVLMSVLNLIEV